MAKETANGKAVTESSKLSDSLRDIQRKAKRIKKANEVLKELAEEDKDLLKAFNDAKVPQILSAKIDALKKAAQAEIAKTFDF